MLIFLIFLFFRYIKPKNYYIDLSHSNLKSFIADINETSTIYIISNGMQIILNETIVFSENITIFDKGTNNELVFDGGKMNIGDSSLNFLNFQILFKLRGFEVYIQNGELSFQVKKFFLLNKF